MIKYLGSKRLLVPTIVEIVRSLAPLRGAGGEPPTVVDFFSGTARVGHALKAAGYRVVANDHLHYAHALAACYVRADRERVLADAERLVEEFNRLPGSPGYFTETFCERSRFLQPGNGARVDAIRESIERKGLEPDLRAVCLVSLMEAADRVDSTTGLQMAYLKSWSPRSFNDLELRVPRVLAAVPGRACGACRLDAHDAADALEGDVAYIDPPYNQHSYLGNYHVWESLVVWDKPAVYGVACKRVDCRERKSVFNSRPGAEGALRAFLERVRCRCLVVSFSDEGFIGRGAMEGLLAGYRGGSRVHVVARGHRRYVGAQIGIHNPAGERVGKVSHLSNTEFLYVVTPEEHAWEPGAGLVEGEAVAGRGAGVSG